MRGGVWLGEKTLADEKTERGEEETEEWRKSETRGGGERLEEVRKRVLLVDLTIEFTGK